MSGDLHEYGDGIFSADHRVPRWMKWMYVILPIGGIISFFFFWNGAWGWWDRGYWAELEKVANTTYPHYQLDETN